MDISRLTASLPLIAPSLLAADFAHLAQDIRTLEEAGAEILHLDIMDGHFVPNLSFGVPVVEAIRRTTGLLLDVHLMLQNPEPYLSVFRKAGADMLSIHIEVAPDPRSMFDKIRQLGALPGLVSNPPTPVETMLPFVNECDLVLTMGVMAGFGGQLFNPGVLSKIRVIRECTPPETLISVDGGVGETTIADITAAGANMFVTGTALFGKPDVPAQFRHLRQLAAHDYKGNASPLASRRKNR
ncbi:MAG: ribulose-phosphate 3-epimerase [Planctomycetaceae bacterium]|jgi:ribulose-phosphate 3-epimerase|nr:ribulose-phosphate 3-epimerase [Planctomycetaceae bacterium]